MPMYIFEIIHSVQKAFLISHWCTVIHLFLTKAKEKKCFTYTVAVWIAVVSLGHAKQASTSHK